MGLRRKRGRHRRRKDRTLPLGTVIIVASAVAGIYVTAAPDGASAAAPTVYVATSGDDSDQGTLSAPYRTLEKAFSVAQAGTTIEVRGGTYYPSRTLSSSVSGTAAERVRLRPHHAEAVRVDGSRLASGSSLISLRADYWTVSDIEFRNAPDSALVCTSCTRGIFKNLTTHGNGDSGFTLRGDHTNGNVIQNLDSYDNHDDATQGRHADGIAITSGSGAGNKVTGARLYGNSDDGIALRGWSSPVTIEHSWAFDNGKDRWGILGFAGHGNGFYLGGGSAAPAHRVSNSAAWDNLRNGFAEGARTGAAQLYHTTSYGNGGYGYFFRLSPARLAQNLAVRNAEGKACVGGLAVSQGNNWDSGVATPSFFTTDPTAVRDARQPGGALPATGFLNVSGGRGLGSTMN